MSDDMNNCIWVLIILLFIYILFNYLNITNTTNTNTNYKCNPLYLLNESILSHAPDQTSEFQTCIREAK